MGIQLRRVLIGTVLYVLLTWLGLQLGWGQAATMAGRFFDAAQTAVVVTLFMGFAFGPFVGFGTGFLGYGVSLLLLTDMMSGIGRSGVLPGLPFVIAVPLDALWVALLGLTTGLAAPRDRRYVTTSDIVHVVVVTLAAMVVGLAFMDIPPLMLAGMPGGDLASMPIEVVAAIAVVPALLYNYSQPHDRFAAWLRSGLVRRLSALGLVSATLPAVVLLFLLRGDISARAASPIGLLGAWAQVGVTVLLTIAFTLINAALAAQTLTRPLSRLTEAARAVSAGTLTEAEVAALASTEGTDEISELNHVFGRMAEEVIRREQMLRNRVAQLELRIQVDEAKKSAEVAQVTETEYFRDLQQRAMRLRSASKASAK